jgi:hypothetical protein
MVFFFVSVYVCIRVVQMNRYANNSAATTTTTTTTTTTNNLIKFFIISVPSQQLQGQLQTQHSVVTGNYIVE